MHTPGLILPSSCYKGQISVFLLMQWLLGDRPSTSQTSTHLCGRNEMVYVKWLICCLVIYKMLIFSQPSTPTDGEIGSGMCSNLTKVPEQIRVRTRAGIQDFPQPSLFRCCHEEELSEEITESYPQFMKDRRFSSH